MKPIRPLVIGVYGGSGTGKSTLARKAAEYLDADLIDGDMVGHDCLHLPEIRQAIGRVFGLDCLDSQGMVDRKALGALVFNDPIALERLNAIMHPVMKQRIGHLIEDSLHQTVILDAAVMIEAGFGDLTDLLILVEADDDIRLQRLTDRQGRGIDESRARAMILAGRKDLRDYEDMLIDTSYDLIPVMGEIYNFLDRLQEAHNA